MYKYFVGFAFLTLVCSLAVWAGGDPQRGKANKVEAPKVKEAQVRVMDSSKCSSPRPPNRGCKIACKPCQIAVCENGKWIYEKVDYPKGECDPHPNDSGGKVCAIGISDRCPAECKKCIRQ
jgi:hypothetical protein